MADVAPISEEAILLPPPSREAATGEFLLGTVVYGGTPLFPLHLRRENFIKHIGIFAITGAGKSNVAQLLALGLLEKDVPFLVVDWKRSYRALYSLPEEKVRTIRIYSVGRKTASPFNWNPLRGPPGVHPKTWISTVAEALERSHVSGPGVADVFIDLFDKKFAEFGVYEQRQEQWPNFFDANEELQRTQFKGRRMLWQDSCFRILKTFIFGPAAGAFNARHPLAFEQLLQQPVVIELDQELPKPLRVFCSDIILRWIHLYRLGQGESDELRHVNQARLAQSLSRDATPTLPRLGNRTFPSRDIREGRTVNSSLPEIPVSTGRELANPAPPGQRHGQIVRIVCALRSRRWQPEAIFHQVRPNYGSDVPDSEIRKIIEWSANGVFHSAGTTGLRSFSGAKQKSKSQSPEDYEAATRRFLAGFCCEESEIWEASPCRLFDDWRKDAALFLQHAFSAGEKINIVADYLSEAGKARPKGFGKTETRENWIQTLMRNPPPESDAGAWVRINPIDGNGIADQNVTVFRFVLLEFDNLPRNLQLAVFARLPIPTFAILTSGGKSLHAWIRVAAANSENYREIVSAVFVSLRRLGIDPSNRNPSRLSRLPGVTRKIGASGDGSQRLLYLNPEVTAWRAIL